MSSPRDPAEHRHGADEPMPSRRVGPRHPTAGGSSPLLPAVRVDWSHLRLRSRLRDGEPSEADASPADEAEQRPRDVSGAPPDDPVTEGRFEERPDTSGRLFRTVPPRSDPTGRARRWGGTRMALATMLRQRRRIALSMLIVALGIGYLAGALSLLQRVSLGLDDLAGTGTEPADLVLEGGISFDSPLEQVRSLIPDELVETVTDVPGVEAAEARIESTAVIVGADGEPVVPLGITQRPAGANWPTEESLNPYRFVGAGEDPSGDDEVVIDSTTAAAGDLAVGDQVGLLTNTSFGTYTITGVVEPGGKALPPGSSLALLDLDTAREAFDQLDDNAIAVEIADDADAATVAEEITARVGPGVVVSTPEEYEAHRRTSLAKSFTLIQALLLGFAGLAVVVGAFTVANSNALLFARRRHGFALLRLAGADRRQLMGASVIEAGFVGVAAVVVGVPLGLGAGILIEEAIGALGAPIPAAGPAVSIPMIAVAAAVGMGVTILSALAPARDAARVPPVDALTRNDTSSARSGLRWLGRLGVALVGGAVLGAALAATLSSSPNALAVGAAAGGAAFVGFMLLPPLLGRLVGGATRLLVGRTAALRSLTALRSRRARTRAASTTAALLLATAVVATLATLSTSFVASLSGEVDRVVTADLVVDSGTFTRGGLPSELVEELQDTEGVVAASGVRLGRALVDGVDARFSALDGDAVFDVVDLGLADPPAELDDDEVLLSQSYAERVGVAPGDNVLLDFSSTFLQARVAGTFEQSSALLGDGVITTDLLDDAVPTSVDILALVDVDPSDPEATTRVEGVAASYGVPDVLPPADLVDERADLLRGFQRVIEWMLLFSVALAVVGVANTLQLSVNERRRELGLLRAVGASRRQVIRLVVVEAGALSLVGALLGIGLGVGLAFGAVSALSNVGLDQLAVPVPTLVGTALAAVALAVVGSFLPAMRAARAGVLEAIGDDPERPSTLAGQFSRFRGARRSRSLTAEVPRSARVYQPPRPVPETSNVDHSAVADTDEHGPVEGSEDNMASRCYNCGNDPGPGERCEVCDASQIPEPMGMFSTAPTAAGGTEPPRRVTAGGGTADPAPGPWTRPRDDRGDEATTERFADIVDAAIVDEEDDDLGPGGHEHRSERVGTADPAAANAPRPGPAQTPPPPPTAPQRPTGGSTPHEPEPRGPAVSDPPPRRPSGGFATRSGPVEEPAAGTWVNDADPTPTGPPNSGTPLGSIFDDPGAGGAPAGGPARGGGTTRSPFGQHANDEQPTRQPEWGVEDQARAPEAATQAPPYQPPPQPPPAAPYVPPPSYPPPGYGAPAPAPAGYGQPPVDPFAQAGVGAPAPGGSSVTPDQQGLAAAIAKLTPASQQHGTVAFCVVGGLLAADELVLGAIQGWSLGMPTVAVLTNSRVLLVSERRWKPVVEIFPLRPGLTIFGRHVDHQASVTLQEADRVVTLDQVADVTAAVELATTARARCTGTGF